MVSSVEVVAQLLKKFHAFDVNGFKHFERQRDERARLLKINVLVVLPDGGVLCSATSLRRC